MLVTACAEPPQAFYKVPGASVDIRHTRAAGFWGLVSGLRGQNVTLGV